MITTDMRSYMLCWLALLLVILCHCIVSF